MSQSKKKHPPQQVILVLTDVPAKDRREATLKIKLSFEPAAQNNPPGPYSAAIDFGVVALSAIAEEIGRRKKEAKKPKPRPL